MHRQYLSHNATKRPVIELLNQCPCQFAAIQPFGRLFPSTDVVQIRFINFPLLIPGELEQQWPALADRHRYEWPFAGLLLYPFQYRPRSYLSSDGPSTSMSADIATLHAAQTPTAGTRAQTAKVEGAAKGNQPSVDDGGEGKSATDKYIHGQCLKSDRIASAE